MGRRDTDSGSSGSQMIYYMLYVGPDSDYYKKLLDKARERDDLDRMVPPLPVPQSQR